MSLEARVDILQVRKRVLLFGLSNRQQVEVLTLNFCKFSDDTLDSRVLHGSLGLLSLWFFQGVVVIGLKLSRSRLVRILLTLYGVGGHNVVMLTVFRAQAVLLITISAFPETRQTTD